MPDTCVPRALAPVDVGTTGCNREYSELPGSLLDRAWHANIARFTSGLSPASLMGAYLDWAVHLAGSPGRGAALVQAAFDRALRLEEFALESAWAERAAPPAAPAADHRFADPAWSQVPFNIYAQSFLGLEALFAQATKGVSGVSPAHERMVSFMARQILDIAAPSNFPVTNPVVLQRAVQEGGANFMRGFFHMFEDMRRALQYPPPPAGNDAVGKSVAVTQGKVVFRSHLLELIQYAPSTETVRPEPVLIVPAWIMKYYILDLSPENSLVRFLVSQGFTVFMISWRNPSSEDRDLAMADYLTAVMAAMDQACAIAKSPRLHGAGYCLGGTLLSIAAAAMARDCDARLASLSLFAAQEDFTEAGELTLFINESQIALLQDMMQETGYLDSRQMAGAFQMLRSNDLIWSRMIQDYLLGDRAVPNDLMAWNADATRMPAAMHAEYLKKLFLNNDLAEGRYRVGGAPVAIADIRTPIFAVGTETDHVAPWHSVHKIHLLTEAEITFVLTSGGHNAGIVSEPGHHGRHFRLRVRAADGQYVAPELWQDVAEQRDGSWWPAWVAWLAARSSARADPPPMGKPLCDAPGTYVHQA